MSPSRSASGVVCLCAAALLCSPVAAQNRLYIGEHSVDAGQSDVSVPVLLDSDQDVYGFSLSLLTDPTKLQFTGLSLDDTAAFGADYNAGLPLDGGSRLNWGVILDVTEPFDVNNVIAPGNGIVIARVIFDVSPGASGTAAIEFRDFPADWVSNPPDPGSVNKITLENGNPLTHARSNGTIRIGGGEGVGPFKRGDCNQDGESLGSPTDGIFLLTYLFVGGAVPTCRAACDMDGDGDVSGSPTDALYFFNFIFLGGPALPDPLRDCALSTRPGDLALGCDNPMGCVQP